MVPRRVLGWMLMAGGLGAGVAVAQTALDVGERVPNALAIQEGLFPEDACKAQEAAGQRCGVPKAAVRYSLPATAFQPGSAELPEQLRRQLDVFGQALRGRQSRAALVRIEGHADASGSAEAGRLLSQRRADAVRQYLVQQGVDAAMLQAVGMGALAPRVAGNPYAADNRRIEIGRVLQ